MQRNRGRRHWRPTKLDEDAQLLAAGGSGSDEAAASNSRSTSPGSSLPSSTKACGPLMKSLNPEPCSAGSIQYIVKNTFIEAPDKSWLDDGFKEREILSCPASRIGKMTFHEAPSMRDEERFAYPLATMDAITLDAQENVKPAVDGPLLIDPRSEAIEIVEPSKDEAVFPKVLNVGSIGHAEGNCKPCAFFHRRGCENASMCPFCHICSPGEKRRRQKEKKNDQRRLAEEALRAAPAETQKVEVETKAFEEAVVTKAADELESPLETVSPTTRRRRMTPTAILTETPNEDHVRYIIKNTFIDTGPDWNQDVANIPQTCPARHIGRLDSLSVPAEFSVTFSHPGQLCPSELTTMEDLPRRPLDLLRTVEKMDVVEESPQAQIAELCSVPVPPSEKAPSIQPQVVPPAPTRQAYYTTSMLPALLLSECPRPTSFPPGLLLSESIVSKNEHVTQPKQEQYLPKSRKMANACAAGCLTSCAHKPEGSSGAPVLLLADALPPSVGSARHHLGICTPCAFLHKQGCTNGCACRFCHLCDPGEKRRRQKYKKITVPATEANKGDEMLCAMLPR